MRPYSDHDQERIQRHRAQREGKGFITIERYTDLAHLELEEPGVLLLECLCNLTSNEMFGDDWMERNPIPAVMAGIQALEERCRDLVVVTNDVGSGLEPYSLTTEDYVRALGTINCKVAQRFDTVLEFVAGIPQVIKGSLPDLASGAQGVSPAQEAWGTKGVQGSQGAQEGVRP